LTASPKLATLLAVLKMRLTATMTTSNNPTATINSTSVNARFVLL